MPSRPSGPYAVRGDAGGRVWVSEFSADSIAEFE
jgi:streptogramin lyase